MRWLISTIGVIAVQVATIAGLYYQRVTGATALTRSDIVVVCVPTIIAAALCAWISYSVMRASLARPGLLLSIVCGVLAAVVGALIAFFVSFNLWGT